MFAITVFYCTCSNFEFLFRKVEERNQFFVDLNCNKFHDIPSFVEVYVLSFFALFWQDGKLSRDEILEHYDLFVGSQATDFGEALTRHDEF